MKIKKKDFEVFNLSFLDVISCSFGAVVLLILISHTDRDTPQSSADEVKSQLEQVMMLKSQVDNLAKKIDQQKKMNDIQLVENGNLDRAAQTVSQALGKKEREERELAGDLDGLSLVQSSLETMSITPSTSNTIRDEEVGGIPVDSDYVIFVIDTSGSMQTIWNRVSQEIINVLTIHPKVKGFQVLDDQGKAIISGYSGLWIPDTPIRRKSVMKLFKGWQSASNSSPVEGVITALKQYKKIGQSMAIYVFGDDYTGDSYDSVIANITKMNTNQKDGQRLAKIHAVGFPSQFTTDRFAILMRELTKQNGGTFLALPIK
ncbi:MAG: VWA domain-containing protein [Nitrosomonadales bacterium]|nr:MAG: VWA domain-containing protein [Nitrosomonadales bacterium]